MQKRIALAFALAVSFQASAHAQSADALEIVAGVTDVVGHIPKAGNVGYAGGPLRIIAAGERLAKAERVYAKARGKSRKVHLAALQGAQRDFDRSIIGAIPVLGDTVDLVEALEKGDLHRVVCSSVSLGLTFASGGATAGLNAVSAGCAVVDLVQTVDEHTKRPHYKYKAAPRRTWVPWTEISSK